MATKKENINVQITLPPFHKRKLDIICSRLGLSRSGIVQRLLESYTIIPATDEELVKKP